jgi:hypothetical protein
VDLSQRERDILIVAVKAMEVSYKEHPRSSTDPDVVYPDEQELRNLLFKLVAAR